MKKLMAVVLMGASWMLARPVRPNATVVVSLFASALAVCGAIFLILDMYQPYGGFIRVSDAPMRAALAQLGQ